MDISVIMPVRDQAALLRELLSGIRDAAPHEMEYEIVVVDDGSKEDIGAVCAEYGARHHRLETSGGPAYARNSGAALAQAPILFFFDGDVQYTRGLFERAKAELDADPKLQAVSFVNEAWRKEDGLVKNYGAAIEHYWFQQLMDGNALARMPGFTTRNGAIRKSAFEAVGGFDTSFRTNAIEDYDFGQRLSERFDVAMVDAPLPYHNFPDRFTRLCRNYFVRTSLFVPYFLKNRPPLDKAQTSGSEAGLRLTGFALFALLAGALLLRGQLGAVLLLITSVLLLLYGLQLRGFLRKVREWSGSWVSSGACLLVHWLTSLVITGGGAWGLVQYGLARMRGEGSAER